MTQKAILKLAANEEAMEMGKESEKKAKTLFTPSTIVKQWMKIIDQ